MRIERIESGYKATVPCKINLGLRVLARRSDGFHDLDTIMLALDLCDEISFIPNQSGQIRLSIEFPNKLTFGESDPAWDVPADQRNLVFQAIDALRGRFLRPKLGGLVNIIKRIPSMAGLGGGSADAAAGLVLAMLACNERDRLEDCCQLASSLGSDINFFLEGGNQLGGWIARCRGRGEMIERIHAVFEDWFVVVHPPDGCRTADVFRKLVLNDRDKSSIDQLASSLKSYQLSNVGGSFENDLEKPAGLVTSWVNRARNWIDCYDHLGQSMTGSGSARFCLCSNREQAEKIAEDLVRKGVRAFAVQPWRQPSLAEQLRTV